MPNIAIDYTPAYEQGAGIGRYVRELVAALARLDEATTYKLFVAGAQALPQPPGENFIWRSVRLSPKWLARFWHRLQVPVPVEAITGKIDLYHATDFVLPPTRARSILTVHDLSFIRVPEAASPRLKAYLDAVVPRSCQRATHILADSQATKDDLVTFYNLSPDKVTVLLSGVDARFKPTQVDMSPLRAKYGFSERPYVFCVGTVQPRKNYIRLIQALAQLRAAGHDLALVIAGGRGWLDNPIYAAIQESGMRDYVHLIGFADDADLPSLYSGAFCVAFTSLYEGFGLPVLEGMACGTPVITSDVSSMPEVAGDAALLVDPYQTEAIVDAIRQLLEDSALRERLVARGFAQAARFTWENSARELMAVYGRVLSDAIISEK
ncbi:MAG: glycosyltransferase family 1 protein [Anaerolineae bacterium]